MTKCHCEGLPEAINRVRRLESLIAALACSLAMTIRFALTSTLQTPCATLTYNYYVKQQKTFRLFSRRVLYTFLASLSRDFVPIFQNFFWNFWHKVRFCATRNAACSVIPCIT